MKKNPYPKEIVDESSGIIVPNSLWKVWEEGYQVGYKAGIEEEPTIVIKEGKRQAYQWLLDLLRLGGGSEQAIPVKLTSILEGMLKELEEKRPGESLPVGKVNGT